MNPLRYHSPRNRERLSEPPSGRAGGPSPAAYGAAGMARPTWGVLLAGLLSAPLLAADNPLEIQQHTSTTAWSVQHRGQTLFTYAFAPGKFKPYVQELATVDGFNLLRDAPHDHLHHHALMYAIRVNGINFWEEAPGAGVQKPIQTSEPALGTTAAGLPQASLTQVIHWVTPQDAFLPDTTPKALLVERRTLTLIVDEPRREVALRWQASFEVGQATNEVTLTGSTYFGLGVRFLQELDPLAHHFTATGTLDLANNRQDVTQHRWAAVAFDRPTQPATFVIFGSPKNAGGAPWFFSMKTPFAYLSATQHLDQQPLKYVRGDRFQLDYLVVVQSGLPGKDQLDARQQRWLLEGR